MKNPFLALGSLFGATGVALGAMGAHALREKLKAGVIDHFQYEAFDKATKYQLFHAIVLLVVYFLYKNAQAKLIKTAGWLFAAGILLFSGSIYFLTTQPITQVNFSWMGPVTPIGGVMLIAGWICLLVHAIANRKDS